MTYQYRLVHGWAKGLGHATRTRTSSLILFIGMIFALLLPIATTFAIEGGNLARLQQQAQGEHQKKHWDKVISLLKSHTDEISVPSLLFLADAYAAKKQHREASQVLKQILSHSENNYRVWRQLGEVHMAMGNDDEATAAFRQAIIIEPQYRPAYEGLVRIFSQRQKSNYELREVFKDMLAQFGADKTAASGLCRIYYEDGFLEQAR